MEITGNNLCKYGKYPYTELKGNIWIGWQEVLAEIERALPDGKFILTIDTYTGTYNSEILRELSGKWPDAELIQVSDAYKNEEEIRRMTGNYITDDEIFGFCSPLGIPDYFDVRKLETARNKINSSEKPIVIYGSGAYYLYPEPDLTVYIDMARWEIQQRFRRHEVNGLGVQNSHESPSRQYKRGYFNDWLLLDEYKKSIYGNIDFWMDTHTSGRPKMISRESFMEGIEKTSRSPFRVVPFFDPAPWGGQWMKDVCDLDRDTSNFGWCFDCVPEENSLLLKTGGEIFEMPSVNLVYLRPEEVLGKTVYERFGAYFPIRFDFLDTIGGGNLSLQVHPTGEYIKKTFGMKVTQDESYYMVDATPEAKVYLGLKTGIDKDRMISELKRAQEEGCEFDTDKFVNCFPAKKHDHFLIPGGTIHCSGRGGVVLEISSTPNLFTFKMWDWNRLGLDGKPRPINIGHAENVINWDLDTERTKTELYNTVTETASGDGWKEEKTGLHDAEFIETRRHWFTKQVTHDTGGGVNVLNLVEGDCVVVESPTGRFAPFEVHYAETFIIPASVGEYIIRPAGGNEDKLYATIKAYVRT